MESGNGGASSKGVLVPVSAGSDAFRSSILAPLKSAYLYEESKQSFRYKSAFLINNPELEEKYNAFREKRKEEGYSEEDLKESYGFLLFDDVNKAHALGETGVLTGNSTCTTLGDPSKGVYISMYSDCLDLNRWYHGKSGYIAIIRLTKGKAKKVLENYTQNFTAPTERFDCHVSEQLPSVSANTSSFLAFERTQYYIYELLNDGSNETVQSPSAAFPFAIVSFSYTDTKATLVAPEEKSEEKKQVFHFYPWRGQLQIGTHFYDVGLRSTARALIPAELPPVVKIDRAISMLDLRQLLPRAVFETCFSGEVFLDGLYCSLCELVSTETEETSSVSLLLSEIKEKDVALTVPLSDGGFLILLHSSHFLTYDDTGSSATEVLQGIFVFPDSRVIQKDTKFGQRKTAVSSEILRVLPVLSYAEGEVEKTPTDPSEELCEVFAQHMQSYAALINPGLTLSPSRDISIFPDQYDVPDAHKHLYKSPEWTNRAWQNFKSYLSKPVSFQLPVSKASEILAAGQEERMEDLDDDLYFCLSSPEEAPASQASMESEDQQTGQKSVVHVETSVDSCITSAKDQVDLTTVPQNECLQPGDATKDTEKSDLTLLITTDDMGIKSVRARSTSDELPAELIVSITSAERTVTDASLSATTAESATKRKDFQHSGFSTAKVQTEEGNSLNDENVKTKKVSDPTNHQTKRRKYHRDNLKSQKEESSTCPDLSKPSNIDWRKVRKRKRIFGTLSSKHRKLRSAALALAVAEEKTSEPGQQSFESTILMEHEAFPQRKKTERWDLKPVLSECGRILVPHGSVDIDDQIKTLKGKLQSTKDKPCHEKMLVDGSAKAHDTVEMEQESSIAKETAVDKTEDTTSKDGGNRPQNVENDNGSLTLNPKSSEHSSKNDSTDTPPLKTVQEKHTDIPSARKCATKGEFLLKKLKSVLLRGKRKMGILASQETAADTTQDTQPCLKKAKVDSESGMLKNNDAITSIADTNLDVKEGSKMLSVDPLFAYALGLTPKDKTKIEDKQIKSESQDTHERKDCLETREETILDKQPQIIQRPLSIFPKRGRIKTLKKHQGISEENVKKKWWLHFQTPACFASEKQTNKECTRDNSVSKTVKEKSNSTCSPPDALTLLADLALSANNDQVPPQPDPALEREPETSLKKCDLTKDVTSGEQESVLHALLRQPAARSMQPLESPSPSHFVGGSELVGLISKEHDYSLPPSSSLLLDLSGTPFQVSPLSGSTRLLHHHQTMYGDGIKTLHHYVDQEDRSENNHRTPEYLKKQMARRRKFRQSRTFVIKDESLQVTKQWKENYDFILDSKFTNDTKERAIVRALHGPWDLSIQDTNEEVRLIVHMWIGLFYSRSTARFFHFDSNCSTPCPEESDSLEVSSGMVSAPAQSELTAKSSDPCLDVTDTSETSISKALDLSKKDNSLLDQGSVILDLSLRNSNVEIVTSDLQANKKKTSLSAEEKEASATLNTLKSSVGLQSSCRKSVHSTDIISKVNDVRSTYESKRTCTPLQKAVRLELSDVPSFKGGGTSISVQDKMASQLEDHKTDSRLGHVLHRFNNEKTDMRDDIDKSCATEMSFVQKQGRDSSRSVIDKEIDSNKKAGDAVGTIEHDDSESKGEKQQVKEKPYQEGSKGSFAKMIHKVDDSTEEESGTVCNGSLLENEKQSSREEPQAVSAGKAEHVNKDEDCRAVLEVKVMEDDHFGKEDGLDEKDNHISDVEADSGVNDQPSPMMRDCPDSLKENYISECNGQTSFDEQPPQADGKGEACHDLELRKLCPNDSAVADEHAVSEKAPRTASEMEPIDNEPAFKENLENGVCLVDLRDDPLPMISDGPDSVKDCITEYNGQTPLVEEPSQANNEEDACNDLELGKLSANGNVLTDEQTILEKAPHAPSEMEPVDNESAVEGDLESGDYLADLSDKPMSMTCDGPDSVRDCVTECNGQAPLDEQPPQADNEDETCSSLELKKLGAHDSALTDERAISEKAPHAQSDMEPIDNETAVDENSENGISLAVLSDQPIPMICDGPDSVNKDCITKCDLQVSLDVQPRQAENKGDTCHDLQLRNVCANDSALTDEPAISEKAPHAQSDMEPIDNETAVDENSENGISLAVLSDQPIPMICDGPDSVNKDCITKCDLQVSLDVQPRQAENKGDTCHDLQLRNVCANDSALTDEPAISEKAPHAQSDMEPIDNETAVEENSENGISLAVLSDQQIPMICDGPDSVNKDCITKCDLQVSLDVQPCQAENKGDTCHDLQLRNVCANAISEKAPHPPSEMDPIDNEPVAEANSENNTCLADEAHFQKSELPISDESTSSLVGSSADGSASQTNDSVATGGQNKAMATFSLSLHDHEEQDTKSDEKELKADDATQKDLFHHQFHSPQRDTVTGCEAEESLHKDTDLKIDETHKGLEKIDGRIVIPFIGIDISGEDVVQSDDSHSEGKVQEVQDQNEITINRENTYPETVLPTEVCSTSQVFSKKEELSAGKKSLFDERETNQLEISESESDERCPTPTMDEEPYQYVSCYDPSSSSSSSFSGSENCKNMTQQHLGRSSTFIKDEMPPERKHKSTVGSDPNRQHGLRPDLELRTLRVLQSIGKFLSQSGHPDKSSQITTTDMERSLDQKDKLQDTSIGHNYCHPHTSFSSTELMQAFPPNIDQDRSKTTSQTNLGHEPRSNSQRPVMAVKPSKSDEIQTPVVTYIPSASMLFEKKTESLKGNSVGLNDDMQEASEHSSKSSCLSNVWDIKSHSNKAQFNQYQGRDPSKLIKKTSSSLPLHSFESAKTSSKLWTNMVADGTKSVDGNQCFLINSLVEKVAQTTNKSTEMDQRDCSDASTSVANYKDDSIMDDSLFLGPQSSITCTVFNTSRKRPVSFLEQLSQRCLQEDLTLASMEQECLIFSEQMKQLLKRSNRGPTHQLDAHNKLNVPCSSPVTVHFSSLEEEEDSLDYLDAPSLVGQKIEVDMSDRTDLAEEENTLHPQKSSQRTGNPMEHAGVSSVTSECARLYKAIMNDVCAVKKVPSTRPKHLRMDKGYLKTEPSNHFDFCEQMKRDVDQSFRSSLNSVVKKSCKTKYRFYILVTSDGAFFDETKAHLEAEGHTAVQPSEFFLDGDSTSSLLIIIRNEDIAEHICEVPHLLELKKSPGVQFAGIDEPDDVVNLTHQELFMKGGFIMFDRAAVESLSLCNMKKISEILQELSKMGKWKWMLHYRDSRRMKENARLSTEAKEKTQFLNWCQEVGILEVLPYHECDLMSRDQPDYLTCLVRLQVQNISARYPVFITDTTTDSAFGTNGILTLTFSSFLTSKTFPV